VSVGAGTPGEFLPALVCGAAGRGLPGGRLVLLVRGLWGRRIARELRTGSRPASSVSALIVTGRLSRVRDRRRPQQDGTEVVFSLSKARTRAVRSGGARSEGRGACRSR